MTFTKSVLGGIAVSALVATAAFAEEWKGWNIHVEGYPNTVAMDKFGELLAEKTNGEITLQMFHGGVLGSQPDAIEQVRAGALAIGNFNLGPMGPTIPETNVVSLPFVFKDVDHMHRAMDGEAGQKISDGMAAKGLIALAWYDSGARSFYNSKKPINTPADVQGMKVRVMNNDLYSGMIQELGGNPSPMAFAEVYQSLKTGVVDGAENNWPSYESTGHFEVAGYYSLSEHLIIPECVCINADVYNALTPEQQTAVKEAAMESATLQRELWATRETESRDKVMATGVKFNEIADKTPFQEAMKPVYETYLAANPDIAPLVELIQSLQ
ncbi:TRAP transporter substrate-binding protein [Silicimonas algicola]|uniref:Tripartite ATP-independent transporter DctP family solute receptor n=1 Tax=Silicimonas algicola TaxID=1826607 RepID=A0A316GVA5_9RHOB|nr:TRAP transporter substrate-binding protein [Silicimonas algicola]AZQ66647.1 TRAP transporter substrate-binding protein [Silicimonas algicola]PWK58997.1 tripartite ATP-independent transporter DctP family solute receptor [Silicimonas algicola]